MLAVAGAGRNLRHGGDGRWSLDGRLGVRRPSQVADSYEGLLRGSDILPTLGSGALPQLFGLAAMTAAAASELAREGRFHPERMRANLDVTSGLIMAEAVTIALGEKIGKSAAQTLLERCARRAREESLSLREALAAEPEVTGRLPAAELETLMNPEAYLGAAPEMARRAAKQYYPRTGQ